MTITIEIPDEMASRIALIADKNKTTLEKLATQAVLELDAHGDDAVSHDKRDKAMRYISQKNHELYKRLA